MMVYRYRNRCGSGAFKSSLPATAGGTRPLNPAAPPRSTLLVNIQGGGASLKIYKGEGGELPCEYTTPSLPLLQAHTVVFVAQWMNKATMHVDAATGSVRVSKARPCSARALCFLSSSTGASTSRSLCASHSTPNSGAAPATRTRLPVPAPGMTRQKKSRNDSPRGT